MSGNVLHWTKLPGPFSIPKFGTYWDIVRQGGVKQMKNIVDGYLNKYGTIMKHELGAGNHEVLVFDPRSYAPVIQQEGKYPYGQIVRSWPFIRYFERREMKYMVGLSSIGPEWLEIRRKLQNDMFPPNVATSYLSLLAPVTKEISSKYAQHYSKDIPKMSNRIAFDLFTTIMFGKSLYTTNPQANERDLRFVEEAATAMTSMAYLIFLPESMANKKYTEMVNSSMDYITSVGREMTVECAKSADPKCYVTRLLTRNELNLDTINQMVTGLLMAGVDTTSHLFMWLLLNTAMHPEKQEKLYEEIKRETIDGELTETNISKCTYLDAFLRESHRYNAAGHVSASKILDRDIVIEGYLIPKGIQITLAQSIQSNAKYVENHDKFIPERWFPEEKAKRKGTPQDVLDNVLISTPFGAGARMCLGARVAQREIAAMLVRLVASYKISVVGSSDYKVFQHLLTFAHPYPEIQFQPRNKESNNK